MTPREAAAAVRSELAAGDEDFALRMVILGVNEFDHALRQALADDGSPPRQYLEAPGPTGSERWDTLLAGAIGRRCRLLGVDPPPWTAVPPLRSWWFVDGNPVLLARTMARTAPDLGRLGVWLDEKAFATP